METPGSPTAQSAAATRPRIRALVGDVSEARLVAASTVPRNPAAPASSFVEAPSVIIGPQPTKFPMTTRDKFMLFAKDMRDPMNIVAAAWNAGIDQASDAHSEFGQGAEGYGKRVGAAMADTATGTFVQGFMFPAIFHQDPRYFTSGKHGTGARLGYAVSRVMVARADSGHWTFNFSEVLGVITTSAVENVYYPDHRTLGDTAVRAGTGIAVDAGWNVLKEFWPDLSRKFRLPIWFQRMFWSSQYTYVYNRPVAPPVDVTPQPPQSPPTTTAPK